MTKISYRAKGEGKVLICLHGYAGSVLHWDPVTETLAKQFQVVTPNLTHLYMGKKQLHFSEQINELASFIKENFPEQKVSLAGISYGGALSWGLTLMYPELIDKVIFVNPMPPNPAKYFALPSLNIFFRIPLPLMFVYFFLSLPVGKFFLKEAANIFRNLQGDFEEQRIETMRGRKLQFISHILWNFSWILRNENWQAWKMKLKNWNHDCLLIYDKKDPLFDFHFYDHFSQIISSTNVVTTQGAGHISTTQQSKLIAGAIREYLLRDYYKDVVGYNG